MEEFKDALNCGIEKIVALTEDCMQDGQPIDTNFPAMAIGSFDIDGHHYHVTLEVKVVEAD